MLGLLAHIVISLSEIAAVIRAFPEFVVSRKHTQFHVTPARQDLQATERIAKVS